MKKFETHSGGEENIDEQHLVNEGDSITSLDGSLPESADYFLSKQDKEVLFSGMYKLKEFFDETPPDALPKVIVFMDISARPLLYFIKL